jgi:cell division protein FtsW
VRRKDDLSDVRRSLKPLILLASLAGVTTLAQGDLGSAIVMTAIVLAVAFIGGVPLVPLLATGALGGLAAIGFVFSSDRRYDRFTAFLDMAGHKDRLSYQTWQGLLAMADGGLTGSGIGAGNGKMGYLPLAHSDFIFAVVGDELGFVGVVAVLGGFGLLVWFGIQAALSSPDRFGMLLAGGIAAWFAVQAIINTGGVSGLLPVTGLTLPFFSAGGSSLFISMTAAGLLLNVARRGQLAKTRDRD